MKKLIFLLLFIPLISQAQVKLFLCGFGDQKTASPYYIGLFDVVLFWSSESSRVATIHTVNPDTKIFQTTDFMRGQVFTDGGGTIPAEWKMRSSTGAYLTYGSYSLMLDPTSYCEPYTGTLGGFAINAEKYNQALPRVSKIIANQFDGIATDGVWNYPWGESDIDIDRNGVNDLSEHGSAWIKTQMVNGWRTVAGSLSSQTGKPIFYNWASISDTNCATNLNAVWYERAMSYNAPWTYATARGQLERWDTLTKSPNYNTLSMWVVWDSTTNEPNKNCFKMARWGLGIALLHGFYFMVGGSMVDNNGAGESDGHHWAYLYDEYEVDLGNPVGRSVLMANGCYMRTFDSGAVVVNTSNVNRTVTSAEVKAVTGYSGTYYYYRGSQDTTALKGGEFSSEILTSRITVGGGTHTQFVGDALYLTKNPNEYAITPLIVDNSYTGTTPGQSTPNFLGSWINSTNSSTINAWCVNSSSNSYARGGSYQHCYVSAGSGATATFIWQINVDGDYNVYEWHSYQGGSSVNNSASVPYVIYHADGVDTVRVNQKINDGQWNYLGRKRFQSGGNSFVKLLAQDSYSGSVVADAIKFEFVPPTYQSDAQKKVFFKNP